MPFYETFKIDPNETKEILRKEKEVEKKKRKGMANLSLICGLVGGWLPLFSIIAIASGHLALYWVKKYPDIYGGKSTARWGVGLGYFELIGLILATWIALVKSGI